MRVKKSHLLRTLGRPLYWGTALAGASVWLWTTPVFAADTASGNAPPASSQDVNPADLPENDQQIEAKALNDWTGFWNRQTMLGDMGGLRSALARYGMTLGLSETSEFLSNTSGGIKQGSAYDGLTTLTLGVDTQKAFGLAGGSFNVSVLNIHGHNLSQSNLGTIQTASGIEADDGTRLWELWYQQKFAGDKADIKVGQQSLDQEFMVSQYAGTFMNTMFGWPAVPSLDMPGGGPAYPLSGVGMRLRIKPSDALTVLGGVFAGDPAARDGNSNYPLNGQGQPDPQLSNANGTNFNTRNGQLYIAELQYAVNQPTVGDTEAAPNSHGTSYAGLPGTYKLGAWYDTTSFQDPSELDSNGNAVMHRGNYSLYAVADQMIWRPSEDASRTLNVFARVMGAPDDRNEISFSANAGITLTAPFEGRDSDTAGLGIGYAKVGSHSSAADAAAGDQVRSSETYLEATYIYQLTPWWQLQGDIQYTINPGAGQNPDTPTQSLSNIWLWGLRTTITF
jgi:porin